MVPPVLGSSTPVGQREVDFPPGSSFAVSLDAIQRLLLPPHSAHISGFLFSGIESGAAGGAGGVEFASSTRACPTAVSYRLDGGQLSWVKRLDVAVAEVPLCSPLLPTAGRASSPQCEIGERRAPRITDRDIWRTLGRSGRAVVALLPAVPGLGVLSVSLPSLPILAVH